MISPLANLHLSYMVIIRSTHKSNNVLIDRMTSFKYYKIILIKINTQLHARTAILTDCDKHAVYQKIITAIYVIYSEGGGI